MAIFLNGTNIDCGQRPAAPVDHDRIQLGDRNPGIAGQGVEHRAQRQPHSEPADEHARRLLPWQPRTNLSRESLLRAPSRAVHEHAAGKRDQEITLTAASQLEAAVGRIRCVEGFPATHQASPRLVGGTGPADYRPFQFGARFSANARGPSMKSSLLSIATSRS